MTSNDYARLNIWESLADKFDYKSFDEQCQRSGLQSMPVLEFAQKTGMLLMSSTVYPELNIRDAYLDFVTKNQPVRYSPEKTGSVDTTGKKPCCGGGTVR